MYALPKKEKGWVLWSLIRSQKAPPYEGTFKNKSINVWEFMRFDGRVELVRYKETMRESNYINLLYLGVKFTFKSNTLIASRVDSIRQEYV